MHRSTSTVGYRWFRGDRDTLHRRRPRRQEIASVGRPAQQSCAVEGARLSSTPRLCNGSLHVGQVGPDALELRVQKRGLLTTAAIGNCLKVVVAAIIVVRTC